MALLGYATRTGLAEVVVQGASGAGYIGINIFGSAGVREKNSRSGKTAYMAIYRGNGTASDRQTLQEKYNALDIHP